MSIKEHNQKVKEWEEARDNIQKFLKNQSTADLEQMLIVRKQFINDDGSKHDKPYHVLMEEYTAIKTTIDMIEDELFVRQVLTD